MGYSSSGTDGCPLVGRRQLRRIITVIAFFAVLAGCTVVPRFELVDEKYSMKPGTIAVISGNNRMFDLDLAETVTAKLKSQSTLIVMDQGRIKSQLKQYPADLISVVAGSELYNSSPHWFSPSDAERIAAFQKQLMTDYIMVVWGENLGRGVQLGGLFAVRRIYLNNIHMRLFAFPSKKIVAYAGFARREASTWAMESEQEMVQKLITSAAKEIVEGLVSTTRLRKRDDR